MSVAGRSTHRLALALLLVPPLAWLVVAYLGSLAVLLVSAFWGTDAFTGAVVRTFTGDNIVRVLTDAVFRTATLRTLGIALAVTVICMVLAVPLCELTADPGFSGWLRGRRIAATPEELERAAAG